MSALPQLKMLSKLKLLTFDVTNTILKVKLSPGQQYTKVAQTCGINIPASELDRVYRSTWNTKKQMHPNYGRRDGISTEQWWADFVEKVFVNAGYKGNMSVLDEVSAKLWVVFSDGSSWEVLPNAHECLSSMKNHGLRLGVISNFDERLKQTLAAHNLDHYFEFLVTSASLGVEKPDPLIFHHALGVSGMTPAETGHVGDDVSHDYHAPKSVGITAFLLDRNYELSTAELKGVDRKYIIRDLLDLNKFMNES